MEQIKGRKYIFEAELELVKINEGGIGKVMYFILGMYLKHLM